MGIYRKLLNSATEYGLNPAIIYRGLFQSVNIKHSEFIRRIRALENGLEIHYKSCKKIGLLMHNRPHFLEIFFAAVKVGIDIVIFPTKKPDAIIAEMIAETGVEILFLDSECRKCAKFLHRTLPELKIIFAPYAPEDELHYNKILAPIEDEKIYIEAEREFTLTAFDAYDEPVVLSKKDVEGLINIGQPFPLETYDIAELKYRSKVVLTTQPFYRLDALRHIVTSLTRGKQYIIMSEINEGEILDAIAECKINGLYVSIEMLDALLKEYESSPRNLSDLNYIMYDSKSTPLGTKLIASNTLPPHIVLINNHSRIKSYNEMGTKAQDFESSKTKMQNIYSCKVSEDTVALVDEAFNRLEPGKIGKLIVESQFLQSGSIDTNTYGYIDDNGFLCILGYSLPDGTMIGQSFPSIAKKINVETTTTMVSQVGSNESTRFGLASNILAPYTNVVMQFYNILNPHKLVDFYFSQIHLFIDAYTFGIHVFNSDNNVRVSNFSARDGFNSTTLTKDFIPFSNSRQNTLSDDNTIVVPLVSNSGKMIGMLFFGRSGANWEFSPEEQNVINFFSTHLSCAMDNAIKYSLLESKSFVYEQVLHSVQVAVVIASIDGEVTFLNHYAKRVFREIHNPIGQPSLLECIRYTIQKGINKLTAGNIPGTIEEVYYEESGRALTIKTSYIQEEEKFVSFVIAPEIPLDFSFLHTSFSDRQIDIIKLIAMGKTNTEIAETLHLSVETIKTYIKQIFSKLGVSSRSQLLAKVCSFISNANDVSFS